MITMAKMDISKRPKAEKLIYDVFSILDPTGTNTKRYREIFSNMSDAEFIKLMTNMIEDDTLNFVLDVVDFERDVDLVKAKKAADLLGVPLEEYCIMPFVNGNKDNPTITKEKVFVGYIIEKRLQQTTQKKNGISINISDRSPTTGQVVNHDKNGRSSDQENMALFATGAINAATEFNGFRADGMQRKNQAYSSITQKGYCTLEELDAGIEDRTILNTIDVLYTGMSIKTDLVNNDYMLIDTMKKIKQKTAATRESVECDDEYHTLTEGLSSYKRVPVNKDNLNKYKPSAKYLSHMRDDGEGYIYLDKDKVVLCINTVRKNNDLWIQGIEISPDYKGKGLSKPALKVAIDEIGRNDNVVYLSVNKSNTLAYNIYKSMGFKEYGTTDTMIFMKYTKNKSVTEGMLDDVVNGVNPYSNKLFFHVSADPHLNGKTLNPRLPSWISNYIKKRGEKKLEEYMKNNGVHEDYTTPRVCFSNSINGALNALMPGSTVINASLVGGLEKLYYVYIPEKPINEYKHMKNKDVVKNGYVSDADITHEMWVLEPVKLVLYGVIKIDQVRNTKPSKMKNAQTNIPMYNFNHDIKWSWKIHPNTLKRIDREIK